jgi:tRNA uridine 5-carboxymethylaminomethyl modification enzyme
VFHVESQVVVVGGGHAGIEAALAASRMGVDTILVTMSRCNVGRMPCNPAIGGQAKGHLVREIDALGGEMALATDAATIQFKYLNTRKGLAVRSSRAQVDRFLYQRRMGRVIAGQARLRVVEAEAAGLLVEGGRVVAVELADGSRIACGAAILTTGTSLRGREHTGAHQRRGGGGTPDASTLGGVLAGLGHRLGRLKTGTVPRVDVRSVDWHRLPLQDGDHPGGRFSFVGPPSPLPQVRCHVAQTTERTHAVVRAGLRHSPIHGEQVSIDGPGPRYCPSVEDKVVRFPQRTGHRLFLEPEGLASREVYVNGFSSSLPVRTQLEALRTVEGLERVEVIRPGYAVAYDFADPRDLEPTLSSLHVDGLWMAGQINGTTGYEEAACQGVLAGINAVLSLRDAEPLRLARDEAYLAVLVDDLTRLGTGEPYRMFTSRAEWRLLLREDNADLRLTPVGRRVGLVDDERWAAFCRKREAIDRGLGWAASTVVRPTPALDAWLADRQEAPLARPSKVEDVLRRPKVELEGLLDVAGLEPPPLAPDEREQVVVQCRYAGYLRRQRDEVERARRLGGVPLPEDLDYRGMPGLRHELVEKLSALRPTTLDEASRIQGMTPSAIALLAARVTDLSALRDEA